MPVPNQGERKEDFLKRCVQQLISQEGRKPEQAYAICNSLWENKD